MEDDVICRMHLGALKVDLMPDDETILGFSNRWYRQAIEHAEPYPLNDSTTINLLAQAYFIATKLEAYLGRGSNDPLSSGGYSAIYRGPIPSSTETPQL